MPENMHPYQGRLTSLRREIQKHGLSGVIVPRTDEFQGEFLAPYAERLAWLTGFTGSAGAAVISGDKSVVMSDGRYTIQLEQQVDTGLYDLDDITKVSVGAWLCDNAEEGARIGYDVWLHTPKQIEVMREEIAARDIVLVPMDHNMVDAIWYDQPARPKSPVTLFPHDVAGAYAEEKCDKIADMIDAKGCNACLITMSDSIAWLLNVRGGDVVYSPLVLSYVLLHANGMVDWFIDTDKVSDALIAKISGAVRVGSFGDMDKKIGALSGSLWMDNKTVPQWFVESVRRHNIDIMYDDDPCIAPKAIKTKAEQDSIRLAHRHDGVAVVRFLRWLDENPADVKSELQVEDTLEGFRRLCPDYVGASFATIAGFAENGAIVHYRATKETNKAINCDGLLLVDSGGQYRWGTTDITRTIAMGMPTDAMREHYTRVLKGHIAVARAVFPKGSIGKDIDALARTSLHEVGLDYAHGTGHGVGCYLCVHEAAASISPRGVVPFEAGMLISNEPGYYAEGAYGIRIENLMFVQEYDSENFFFETVTFAPLDFKLIDFSFLNAAEIDWVRDYHVILCDTLEEHLSKEEYAWLRNYALSA